MVHLYLEITISGAERGLANFLFEYIFWHEKNVRSLDKAQGLLGFLRLRLLWGVGPTLVYGTLYLT